MFSFNQFNFDKNTFIFHPTVQATTGTVIRYATFTKPPGIKFVHILAVGGGGGGGAGASWISSTNRWGGGGGGGASVVVGLFPANLLPNTLYVCVGRGGGGGAAGNSGTPGLGNSGSEGNNTEVHLVPQPNLTGSGGTLIIARGGDSGTGGSINGAGAGGTAFVFSSAEMPACGIGTFKITAGVVGVDATSGGTGLSVSPYLNSFVSGGAGGGRLSSGNVSASGGDCGNVGAVISSLDKVINTPVIFGGSSTINGSDGFLLFKPYFLSFGGGGGGAGTTTVGSAGDGGKGGIGSGGGGGGGGRKLLSGDTWNAGFGGRGGDGIVIITCW